MRALRSTLMPILALLDEGLRLYRNSFSRFLLLTSIAALPFGLIVAALFLGSNWLNSGLNILLFLVILIGSLPLSIYVMGALSRAATMITAGQPLSLRKALAIRPLRVVGMGCYSLIFTLVVSIVVSMISIGCFCVGYLFIFMGMIAVSAGLSAGPLGQAAASMTLLIGILAMLLIYVVSLVLNGAVYGSVVYAVQPFVQDDLRFGATVRRSLDLVGYRLGQNLLTFLSASLVFGAAALAATLGLGVILPLPALFLLGSESPVARAIAAAAWVVGVAVATPLLPIWMALLYQRRRSAREGEDLAQRIASLAVSEQAAD